MKALFGPVPGRGQIYNVASGRTATLLDLCAILGRLAGCDVVPNHESERTGDIRYSAAGISRIQGDLDYAPGYNLETGLRILWESLAG